MQQCCGKCFEPTTRSQRRSLVGKGDFESNEKNVDYKVVGRDHGDQNLCKVKSSRGVFDYCLTAPTSSTMPVASLPYTASPDTRPIAPFGYVQWEVAANPLASRDNNPAAAQPTWTISPVG